MASYNRVVLLGNCTRDPEVKYTPKGTAVTELGLAVNRYYSTEGGEKREETTFVDVTLWGRPAEIGAARSSGTKSSKPAPAAEEPSDEDIPF